MVEEKDNLDTLTEEKWNSLGVLQDFEFDDPTWKVKLKGPNDTMLGMVYFDDGWFFEDSMGRRISMEELGWGDSVVVCNEEGEAEENDLRAGTGSLGPCFDLSTPIPTRDFMLS